MLSRSACRNLLRSVSYQKPFILKSAVQLPRTSFARQYASASHHPATDPPTAEELKNNHDYFYDKDGKRRVTVEFEYPGKN